MGEAAGPIVLSIYVCIMAVFDLVSFRIPNAALVLGAVLATFYRLWMAGAGCVPDLLAGAVIPFLLCFLLYALSMMGAGDVKLLMVIGIYAGAAQISAVMLDALLIAAVFAVIRLIMYRITAYRACHFMFYIRNMLEGRRTIPVNPYISKEEIAGRSPWLMHLAVPAAIAVLCRYLAGIRLCEHILAAAGSGRMIM